MIDQLLGHVNSLKISKELRDAIQIYHQTNFYIADCVIIAHSSKRQLLSFDEKMRKF